MHSSPASSEGNSPISENIYIHYAPHDEHQQLAYATSQKAASFSRVESTARDKIFYAATGAYLQNLEDRGLIIPGTKLVMNVSWYDAAAQEYYFYHHESEATTTYEFCYDIKKKTLIQTISSIVKNDMIIILIAATKSLDLTFLKADGQNLLQEYFDSISLGKYSLLEISSDIGEMFRFDDGAVFMVRCFRNSLEFQGVSVMVALEGGLVGAGSVPHIADHFSSLLLEEIKQHDTGMNQVIKYEKTDRKKITFKDARSDFFSLWMKMLKHLASERQEDYFDLQEYAILTAFFASARFENFESHEINKNFDLLLEKKDSLLKAKYIGSKSGFYARKLFGLIDDVRASSKLSK